MRTLSGVLSVIAVAILMAMLSPFVVVAADVGLWIVELREPFGHALYLVTAAIALCLLAFGVTLLVTAVGRGSRWAWLGIPLVIGYMVGGLAWESTPPVVAWAAAPMMLLATSVSGYAGVRAGMRRVAAARDLQPPATAG